MSIYENLMFLQGHFARPDTRNEATAPPPTSPRAWDASTQPHRAPPLAPPQARARSTRAPALRSLGDMG